MHLSKTKLAVIALIIANVIWGAASPIYKWALMDIHPMTLGFLRFYLAAIILLPLVVKKLDIKKKDITQLIALSIMGITIQIGLYLVALEYTKSVNAPVIGSTGPIFIVIASVIFLREKLRPKVFIGTAISLIGVLIIILQPVLAHGLDVSVLGNVLLVFSTFMSVGYTIMLKRLAGRYDPIVLTFWTFFIGAIGFFPFFLFDIWHHPLFSQLHFQGISGLLFAVIFASVIGYIFNTYALKYVGASEVGIFTYMDPVMAILVAWPLLGETITYAFFLGTVLTFLGIFISEGRLHYHPIHLLFRKEL